MFLHRRFNTSHVVIYREIKNKKTWELCVSIHLMLLFIQFPFCDISSQNSFNTSHVVIYRLNMISTETEFIGFNTSHVVIYPDTQYVVASGYNPFQYISCCYLSLSVACYGMDGCKFQYISCCYLSMDAVNAYQKLRSFNTSHVVIYHKWDRFETEEQVSFNTSHVVIYLGTLFSRQITFTESFNTSHVVIYLYWS